MAGSATENTKDKPATEKKKKSATLKKNKALRRVWGRARWVWKKLQTAMWVFHIIGTMLCLLWFTYLLQPTYITEQITRKLISTDKHPVKVSFTETKFNAEDAVEVDFTISKVNITWGLGFDVRDETSGLRAFYIWIYHDTGREQEITPDISVRMWITCKEEIESIPIYFEKPWKGGWDTESANDIKIMFTKSTIFVHNVKNESHEEATCWTNKYHNLKIQVECWTIHGACPKLRHNCKTYPYHFFMALGINIGSITTMGVVLGCILATMWVRLVNINVFYLLPLWKTPRCDDEMFRLQPAAW